MQFDFTTNWFQGYDLALATNENVITLRVADLAGNVTVTNVTVVRSEVVLTITSTPTGEALYEPTGTVSGTISDPAYTVTVNGVQAVVDEYGNWSAAHVPNVGSGTATFDVVAEPPGGGGGAGGGGGGSGGSGGSGLSGGGAAVGLSAAAEEPAVVRITRYLLNLQQGSTSVRGTTVTTWTKDYQQWQDATTRRWRYQGRGSYGTQSGTAVALGEYAWSETDPVGTEHYMASSGEEWSGPMGSDELGMKQIPHVSVDHEVVGWGGWTVGHGYAKGVRHEWRTPWDSAWVTVAA